MGLLFTNIEPTGTLTKVSEILDISLSERTKKERNKLKSGMDDFATFKWCGYEMFKIFGAFIINKDSLKFYNGPTFTNQYVNPQFESAAAQLTGVNFKPQTISFTMGVYWISEEDYRKLIYLLNPYEINNLMFDFDKDHYYYVKLSSRENGIRYIVGKEDNKPMYYTEIQLSFEVQGPACAYNSQRYKMQPIWTENNEYQQTFEMEDGEFVDNIPSDLAFPFTNQFDITLTAPSNNNYSLNIESRIVYQREGASPDDFPLFSLSLTNLTWSLNSTSPETYSSTLHIRYNSESGLLTWSTGDDEYQLLTSLTTVSTGKRIVKSLNANKYTFPGKFDDPWYDFSKVSINTIFKTDQDGSQAVRVKIGQATFADTRGRTNLI